MSYGLSKGKKEAGGDVVGRPQVRYQVVPLSPYPLHGGVLEWCVCVCVCVLGVLWWKLRMSRNDMDTEAEL